MFENNLKIVAEKSRNWIGEYYPTNVEYSVEKNLFIHNGQNIKLDDCYDESQGLQFEKNCFFVIFGIANLNEIKEVIKNKSENSKVIIIEPNPAFLSYALNCIDLSVLNRSDIYIFSDTKKENLSPFFSGILLTFENTVLVRNIEFYFNNFYKNFEFQCVKEFINEIRQIISTRIRSLGNSQEDCLLGLKHNFENIDVLKKSIDVSKIRNLYKNKPAILVSAGPSLNKNIQYLKHAKGKSLIIAVDTIVMRLINEGIVPDFICSIERGQETYDYFYKDKKYPKDVTLVGPLVLYPKIFEEFEGSLLIPFRKDVAEYYWLEEMTGIKDSYVSIGLSCAHVGFGIAEHLGCSPIILVGQDLAYGQSPTETHAGGTVYDNKDDFLKQGLDRQRESAMEIDGYYGGKVSSNNIWIQFKKAFENAIVNNNLHVINATEGGAKIFHTEQLTLKQAIDQYCSENITSFRNNDLSVYNYEKVKIYSKLRSEMEFFSKLKNVALKFIYNLEKLEINLQLSKGKYNYINKILYESDELIDNITGHDLLKHNFQFILLNTYWQLESIDKEINAENLLKIRGVKQKTLWSIVASLNEIEELIKNTIEK